MGRGRPPCLPAILGKGRPPAIFAGGCCLHGTSIIISNKGRHGGLPLLKRVPDHRHFAFK